MRVELHFHRAALRIVEEVHFVLMGYFVEVGVVHRHVRENLSMVDIICRFRMPELLHNLLHTHTIMIVTLNDTLVPSALHAASAGDQGLLQSIIFMICVRRLTISIIIIENRAILLCIAADTFLLYLELNSYL